MTDNEFSRSRRPRARWFTRAVLPVVGTLAALSLAACEPAPAPDGRDLGVVIDMPPATVASGASVDVAGTLTNHGTAPATGAKVTYAVTSGFTVVELDLGGAATCAPVSTTQTTCTLDEPLGAGESLPFTARSIAADEAGVHTHLIGSGSDGTEPDPDTNTGFVTFPVEVRTAAPQGQPVEMGNGTNYLGTGNLLAAGSGRASEGFNLAVNPYCTGKVNGDRYQSGYLGMTQSVGTCTDPNPEYRPEGYTYVIDVPEARTSAIDVMLWDARYNADALASGELGIDSELQAGPEPFTFTLFAPDETPLDWGDNPTVCNQTFTPSTPFSAMSYLGSSRWNSLCTLSPGQPAGRYLLRVRNGGAVTSPKGDGSNQFAVVARMLSGGTDPMNSLCDRASRPDCPVIAGPGETSISVVRNTNQARVLLGAVDAGQGGRVLRIELFDPGEGMAQLRLLAPTGPGTWTPAPFTWSSPDVGASTSPTTSLDVRQSRFNGRLVTIDVDLAGYQPPPGNDRWLVEYVADSTSTVTDRTTWNARIVDHPAP